MRQQTRPRELVSGVLEGSNVNVADAMVNMIELARRFDLQVKAMRTAEDDGAASASCSRPANHRNPLE